MRSPSRAMPLALALASGLVTSGLLYAVLKTLPQAPQPPVATEPMVVTATSVHESEPLSPDAVAVIQVPHRPDGAFASASDVQGRMSLVDIPKGQPILSSHLAPEGTKPALWHRIPAGMRAVTVAIDEVVGVGGFLKPGLRVDIVGVAQGDGSWTTRMIAQDVAILATAQDDKSKTGDTGAHVVPSATLLVSPQQAEAVSLATEQGKIRLVLRAPDDHRIVKLPPVKAGQPTKPAAAPVQATAPVVAAHQPPAPVAPHAAPAAPGIEVIRGNQSEVVKP